MDVDSERSDLDNTELPIKWISDINKLNRLIIDAYNFWRELVDNGDMPKNHLWPVLPQYKPEDNNMDVGANNRDEVYKKVSGTTSEESEETDDTINSTEDNNMDVGSNNTDKKNKKVSGTTSEESEETDDTINSTEENDEDVNNKENDKKTDDINTAEENDGDVSNDSDGENDGSMKNNSNTNIKGKKVDNRKNKAKEKKISYP